MRATPNWEMYFTLDAELTHYLASQRAQQRKVRLEDPFREFPTRKFWLERLTSPEK